MLIEYLGHSCFFVKGASFSVVIDPFGGIGYGLKRVDCDYAISSHGHFDHNNFSGVNAKKTIVSSFGPFTAVPCFHDDANGLKRGKNNAFFFDADGLRLLHLGDLGEPFSVRNAEKFKVGADVLFLPVGGNYTIDGKAAAAYAKEIGARVTVPMHYKTENSVIDISGPEEFLGYFPGYKTVKKSFELTAENLNGFSPVTFIEF
ncbi:MAG: MBL fold metallo-hydrolase [Clostridia bacterium]|nr:MBL fold metallo-hydrolase [Clostridia bacterium]